MEWWECPTVEWWECQYCETRFRKLNSYYRRIRKHMEEFHNTLINKSENPTAVKFEDGNQEDKIDLKTGPVAVKSENQKAANKNSLKTVEKELVGIKDDVSYISKDLKSMKTVIVPPPTKKILSANKTGIEDKSKKENPEKQKEFNEKFDKSKVPMKVEVKFKKDLIDSMSKLCNDTNSATEVGNLQEFRDFCKKNIRKNSTNGK